jgi:hypothetical protein
MIQLQGIENISGIYLTVTLIILLMTVEFGNDRIKKYLWPIIIILMLVFLIIAGISIWNQIRG